MTEPVTEYTLRGNSLAPMIGPGGGGGTQVSVDGVPVSTLDIDSTPLAATGVAGKGMRVYASGTGQSLTSNSIQALDINTTEYNDDTSIYNVDLTGNTVLVNVAGLYMMAWSLKFTGGAAGQRVALVRKDFTTVVREAQRQVAGSLTDSVRGSDTIRLAAGTYLELGAYVDGGSSVSVVSDILAATGLSLAYLGA